MALTPTQEQNLRAFLKALAQQTEPLPPGLQDQIHAIGLNLTNRVMELVTIATSHPALDNAFVAVRHELQTQDGQRSKGVRPDDFTPADQIENIELSNSAVQILTSPDPVTAAKSYQDKPSSPSKPSKSPDQSSNFIQRIFRRG